MATAAKTPTIKELKERKLEIQTEMVALLDKRGRRDQDFTETDMERFAKLETEAKNVIEDISLMDRMSNLGFDDDEMRDLTKDKATRLRAGTALSQVEAAKERNSILFRTCSTTLSYMEADMERPVDRFLASDGYRKAFRAGVVQMDKPLQDVVRVTLEKNELCPEGVTTGDYESGGFLTTPLQMLSGILRCCDRMVKMRSLARIFTVDEACSLGVRKNTGEVSTAEWGNECVEPTCSSPTGNVKVLTPTIISSCTSLCRELLRRTPDGTENYFVESLARAISEKMEEGYLYGTGLGMPLGLLTKDAVSSDRYLPFDTEDGEFTGDTLIDMLCNIPECYQGGNLAWMGSRQMWCAIMKLQTPYGYLWSATADRGLSVGVPTTLLGFPFMVSEFMSSYTPNQANSVGNVPLVLGDFSQYWIADRRAMLMERDVCVAKDRVAWYARNWTDGMHMCDEAFSFLVVT